MAFLTRTERLQNSQAPQANVLSGFSADRSVEAIYRRRVELAAPRAGCLGCLLDVDLQLFVAAWLRHCLNWPRGKLDPIFRGLKLPLRPWPAAQTQCGAQTVTESSGICPTSERPQLSRVTRATLGSVCTWLSANSNSEYSHVTA